MKKRILAVLCTATALGAVLAVPTAAHAADPYRQFSTYANSSGISVDFPTPEHSMEGPKGLKVHIRAKGTSTPVATLTSFTQSTHCRSMCDLDTPEWWVFSETGPVRLAALGQYTVDVEYQGTEGEPVLHKDRATLDYRQKILFEDVAAQEVSLAKRDTVVLGTVKLYDPRDDSKKPHAGSSVAVSAGRTNTSVRTDAQGRLTTKLTLAGTEESRETSPHSGTRHVPIFLTAKLDGVKEVGTAQANLTALRARVALDSPKETGAYGTRAGVSGALTWKSPDGSYKPVPKGTAVKVGPATATTDDTGRFNGIPMFLDDAPWTVAENSHWLYGSGPQVTVDTTAGSRFTDFQPSVDMKKTVNVKARFDRAEIPAGTTSLKVEVQHSADGKTGWTTRKSLDVPTDAGSNATAIIDTTLPYPGAGHFRLLHAGANGVHGSVTPAAKVSRIMTAIPQFNASPEPVGKGGQLTVTGKLTEAAPAWTPFTGQTVHYYFRRSGTTVWKFMGESRTNGEGVFSKTFTAEATGSWTARYEREQPYKTHFYAASRIDEVIVNP